MEPEVLLLLYIVAAGIVLLIMFYIIKAAVYAGTSELRELLQKQLRIQKRELRKQGLNEAEVSGVVTED